MIRQRIHRFLKKIFDGILRVVDETKFDEYGIPHHNKFSISTRSLTSDEYAEMIDWMERNILGPMVMGKYGYYWTKKDDVLNAHRRLLPLNGISISAPFTFKLSKDYETFKAKWG